MATINIEITTDGTEDGGTTVSRMLSDLSSRVTLWDSNADNWLEDEIPLRDDTGRVAGCMTVRF